MSQLKQKNFLHSCLAFEDRQAGVSIIYCHIEDKYFYNVYCMDVKILKDLMSVEFNNLDEALDYVNEEFGTWKLHNLALNDQKGCAAKS